MDASRQAEAVMLLTVSFGSSDADTTRPLTPTEWGEFAGWLKDGDPCKAPASPRRCVGYCVGIASPRVLA